MSLPAGRVYFSSACWDKEERAEAEQLCRRQTEKRAAEATDDHRRTHNDPPLNAARARTQAEAEVDLLKKEIEGIIDTKEAAADYAKVKGDNPTLTLTRTRTRTLTLPLTLTLTITLTLTLTLTTHHSPSPSPSPKPKPKPKP